jgi:uncharacterized cupredoxin-like copper-binding protein
MTGSVGADGARRIEIEMTDLRFSTTSIVLRSGERVVLAFKNSGVVAHEFTAGRSGRPGIGYASDLLAGVHFEIDPPSAGEHGAGHETASAGVQLLPGQTATLTFVVPQRPGTFEFGCFIPGHYEAGMKGSVTIR